MSAQAKDKQQQGFTIIEVLIVLAIAALILSIVLLALPALQRNGRNNQRQQDAAQMLDAVSRYGLNHSGEFPPSKVAILPLTKLTFYDDGVNTIQVTPNIGRTNKNRVTSDKVIKVYNYAKCNNTGGAVSIGAGYDDVVALFAIETNQAGPQSVCQKL